MYRSQHWLWPIGLILMVVLIGCGHNDGSSSGSGITPGGSGNGTPASSATPSGPPAHATQTPSQPPPGGAVVLQVGGASYTVGSTVHITIRNQSGQAINFADHLTNCTVLTVQRQVGGSWQPMAPCRLETPTRLHTLSAGASMDVSILTAGPWPAGVYRARLDYRTGPDMSSGAPGTAYSSQFRLA